MIPHHTHSIHAWTFPEQGSLGSVVRAQYRFPCGYEGTRFLPWCSPRAPSAACPRRAVTACFGDCLSDLSAETVGKESIEICASGPGPDKCCGFILLFSLELCWNAQPYFRTFKGCFSNLSRRITAAGNMRAWTSHQLYQESFFPAKPVRGLLSGNLGLKLLFSYFTDGLNEWFTRRAKD